MKLEVSTIMDSRFTQYIKDGNAAAIDKAVIHDPEWTGGDDGRLTGFSLV